MNSEGDSESVAREKALYSARPSLFLGRPVWTLLSILLIVLAFAGVLGLELGLFMIVVSLVVLITLWFESASQTLIITASGSVFQRELLSSDTKEIAHSEVRYVHVKQDALQRMLGTGALLLSTIGPEHIELTCPGIRNPDLAKALIEEHAAASGPGSVDP